MAVTREQLYAEVWAEPMTAVAARYGVSSSFLARVCTRLNVPRPPRGYWAKRAVGRASPRPTLPDPRPEDELVWVRAGEAVETARALPKALASAPRRRRSRPVRSGEHPLLVGAAAHFTAGRVTEGGYLKPSKRRLVDLYVSRDALGRALHVASALFAALQARGHRVAHAPRDGHLGRVAVDERKQAGSGRYHPTPWAPDRPTVVCIGTVAIGLTLFELSEAVEVRYVRGKYVPVAELPARERHGHALGHSWTTTQDRPSGRLALQAYSPYGGADWQRQWREARPGDWPGRLPSVARELERAAPAIVELVAEARRRAEAERQRWEVQRRRWREEEDRRRRAQARKDSREQLLGIIGAWAEARRIEAFLAEAEQCATGLNDEARSAVLERIRRARELLGGTDALERLPAWRAPEERYRGIDGEHPPGVGKSGDD